MVTASLAKFADDSFESVGFQRKAKSLTYNRKLQGCTQSVEVAIEHGPRDNPNAAAAIYPWLAVNIPVVDTLAVNMTGGDESLFPSNSSTLRQPIELVAPKGVSARWYLYQPDSVTSAIQEFGAFSAEWLFHFMDEYSSVRGIISLRGDERVLHDQCQFLRVVAAMISSGEREMAQSELNMRFGRPAMRRRFARVFDYVQKS